MKFPATLYVLAAFVATALATSVTDVKNSILALDIKTQVLGEAVAQLPSTAPRVVSDLSDLGNAFAKATMDIKGVARPVAENDGVAILTDVKNLKTIMLDTLNKIAEKKDAFKGLNLLTGVLQDLKSFKLTTTEFQDALIATAPTNLQVQVASVRDELVAGFNTAIAVYSSSNS